MVWMRPILLAKASSRLLWTWIARLLPPAMPTPRSLVCLAGRSALVCVFMTTVLHRAPLLAIAFDFDLETSSPSLVNEVTANSVAWERMLATLGLTFGSNGEIVDIQLQRGRP